MGLLQILMILILNAPVQVVVAFDCPFGTCTLQLTNCSVAADMIRFYNDTTFCNGRGGIISKAGMNKTSCSCFPYYYGTECQHNYTFEFNCTSSVECNGGVCNGTKCERCPSGWRGQRCEIETISDPPVGTKCENGGSQYAFGNRIECLCACGFTGDTCSEMTHSVVNDTKCNEIMCNGRGFCTIRPDTDTAYCRCFGEFTGQFCQNTLTEQSTKLPDAIPVSTTSSSTFTTKTITPTSAITTPLTSRTSTPFTDVTTEVCSNNRICLNGGSCVRVGGIQRCICACGFHGSHCEVNLDPEITFYDDACRYIPCLNNGTCVRTADGCQVECKCSPQFSGTYCEQAIKTTSQAPNNSCKTRLSECATDRDCANTKICKIVDKCGSTQCYTDSGVDSSLYSTVAISMTAMVIFIIAICGCFFRRYFKHLCSRGVGNARGQPRGRICTISGAHISVLDAGNSSNSDDLPSYDEACEKPPDYSEVVNGYRAIFEHPGTRIQSISDCIHL
ncbi:fibropellin-1-like [Dreissena polymorpha]|uniref:EGF-like domain-containing protein n=1 Tax=Dreissena polymorpha TaxID=45954 RepID=A0A9D3Z2K4_DREPO|nr:fibropellin-1-like [Dreissena polymorpha]KAH3711893.1 hypothetical protein DPMN_071569 [Dreissena polymorpha]